LLTISLLGLLRQFGRSWDRLSEVLPDKSLEQCKQFFYKERKRYQLDKIVHEFKKVSIYRGESLEICKKKNRVGSTLFLEAGSAFDEKLDPDLLKVKIRKL
jgi:hypothetical protein